MQSIQESSGASSSGPSPALLGQYGGEYSTALGLNQSNYQNILGQYAQSQQNIGIGAGNVAKGYGALGQQVQGTIQGIGASQSQAIQDAYAKQSGGLAQSLISSGLGNTTVSGSMQRGLTLDAQKAQIALANQMAQLQAGYQASLGGAGLQSQMQGVGLQSQGGNSLLGALAGYKTPYPSWPPSSSQSNQQSRGVSGLGGGGGFGGGRGGLGGSNGLWAQGGGGGMYPSGMFGNQFLGAGQGLTPLPVGSPGGGLGGSDQGPVWDAGDGNYGYEPTYADEGAAGFYEGGGDYGD